MDLAMVQMDLVASHEDYTNIHTWSGYLSMKAIKVQEKSETNIQCTP